MFCAPEADTHLGKPTQTKNWPICKVIREHGVLAQWLPQLVECRTISSPLTAIGPPLRQGVRLGGPISPYLAYPLTQVGVLNRLVLNHLGSSAARLWCYPSFHLSLPSHFPLSFPLFSLLIIYLLSSLSFFSLSLS